MGEIISLTEATHRYRIGEKTLRKWIRNAGLGEKKPDEQKRMQWEIDTDDLERLIEQKRTGTPTPVTMPGQPPHDVEQITALASELSYQGEVIEALKQELGELGERLTTLENRLDATPSTPVQVSRQPVALSPQVAPMHKPPGSRSKSERTPLPPNWAAWDGFIRRHGGRVDWQDVKALNRQDYCQSGEYKSGKSPVAYALDPAGQDLLLRKLRETPSVAGRLQRCDVEACPCHDLDIRGSSDV